MVADASGLIAFLQNEQCVANTVIAAVIDMGVQERNDLDAACRRDVERLKAICRRVSLARRLGAVLLTDERHE